MKSSEFNQFLVGLNYVYPFNSFILFYLFIYFNFFKLYTIFIFSESHLINRLTLILIEKYT